MSPIVIGLIAIGFTMVRGCQHGPFGRTQVVALSTEQEERLGMQAFREVLSTSKVLHRGPTVDAVNDVKQRLVAALNTPEFQSRIGIKIP